MGLTLGQVSESPEGAKNAHFGASFLIIPSEICDGCGPEIYIFTQHIRGL